MQVGFVLDDALRGGWPDVLDLAGGDEQVDEEDDAADAADDQGQSRPPKRAAARRSRYSVQTQLVSCSSV